MRGLRNKTIKILSIAYKMDWYKAATVLPRVTVDRIKYYCKNDNYEEIMMIQQMVIRIVTKERWKLYKNQQ